MKRQSGARRLIALALPCLYLFCSPQSLLAVVVAGPQQVRVIDVAADEFPVAEEAQPSNSAQAVGRVVGDTGEIELAAASSGQSEAGDSPEVTKQKQQILDQLSFDRRPSALLKSWSVSEEELLESLLNPPKPVAPRPGIRRTATPVAQPEPAPVEAVPLVVEPGRELTEEEKKAKALADAAVQKALADKEKVTNFRKQVAGIQIAVMRGQWDLLRTNLSEFSDADKERIYQKLLESLIAGPPNSPRDRSGQIVGERNLLKAVDILAIAELCPTEALSVVQRALLGQLVSASQIEGEAATAFPEAIRRHLDAELPERKIDRRVAAQMFFSANRPAEALSYLPSLEEAKEAEDLEGLDLLCDALLAMSNSGSQSNRRGRAPAMPRPVASPTGTQLMEDAWQVIQVILELHATLPPSPPGEKTTAEAEGTITGDITTGATASREAALAGESSASSEALTADAAQKDDVQKNSKSLTAEQRDEIAQKTLRRAVLLAPKLKHELGEAWLAESFTSKRERGRRILEGIGSIAAKNMGENPGDVSTRLDTLKLQQTAAEAVLDHVQDDLSQWAPAMHLMAINWLREATYSSMYDTSSSRGSQLNRDEFGNYYWAQDSVSFGRQVQEGMPQAIPSGQLLETRPSERWLAFLEPTFLPTSSIATARLHLRVKEEADAFPHIEAMAKTHPDEAKELVRNFMEVWSENHDPNNARRRTSVYMYSFGYGERSNGIPLTRSHQQRNLKELAEWVRRIRALDLPDIDDQLFARAFMAVHSAAEVYRLDDMEAVFGKLDGMSPRSLSTFLTTMQNNLGSVWRMPQVQQDSKTNRDQKDIEAEVQNGYATALALCEKALLQHPNDWNLLRVKGAISHDLVNYQNEIQKSSSFAADRLAALRILQSAAESYVQTCGSLPENELSVEPFQTWFYAALGDSSLGQISQTRNPLLTEMDTIRSVLSTLPAEFMDKHQDMFANDLFTRMSTVNPAVKFRYVREGLKMVGDRPQAREATRVFEYYNDLVTEIQLTAEIDGSPNVGHGKPFGVLVSLRHTQAIERESGGFSRYLQNQKSGGGYYNNSGRPTEDYRDKFEKAARETLDEHFEVLSFTFEPEGIRSRPDAELGWRQTPYVYVLLKARGPEIDRLPPMRLDLDFLDTTGYVVLPVETPQIALNCNEKTGDPRPVELVSITQTLDEREAKEGKLSLEIKAVGKGVLPDLEELVDLKFADFEVADIEDNKLSIVKFDESSSEPIVLSEHLWTVSLRDNIDQISTGDRSFTFPRPLIVQGELQFQRYDDADLKSSEASIILTRTIETVSFFQRWRYQIFALLAAAGLGIAAWFGFRSKTKVVMATDSRWAVPDHITPFTVLSLLRDIERHSSLPPQSQSELATSISQIERYYFAEQTSSDVPDLDREARRWVSKGSDAEIAKPH